MSGMWNGVSGLRQNVILAQRRDRAEEYPWHCSAAQSRSVGPNSSADSARHHEAYSRQHPRSPDDRVHSALFRRDCPLLQRIRPPLRPSRKLAVSGISSVRSGIRLVGPLRPTRADLSIEARDAANRLDNHDIDWPNATPIAGTPADALEKMGSPPFTLLGVLNDPHKYGAAAVLLERTARGRSTWRRWVIPVHISNGDYEVYGLRMEELLNNRGRPRFLAVHIARLAIRAVFPPGIGPDALEIHGSSRAV